MSGVMWQMRRVRLDRIGAPAARFLGVELDLTNDAGHPLDSILWLRNGGGKSTVLSLICALIRPNRRDFLATSATDKHLEDYVLGADTAHVTIEWSGPDGRRLVTGAVYEWTDRVQPADPNRDHDKLESRWYAFTPVPGRAELDLLPFTADGGEPTPLKEFAAAIRGWDTIPGCRPTVTDVQEKWATALDDQGLDPELFTAILQMNATEGGIESQFQFRNADQFVRYLLELIIDPDTPGKVAKILKQVRAGLAERPALIADLTFADEAVPLLHRLDEARTGHATAAATHTAARAEANTLRGQLVAGAAHADTLAEQSSQLAAAEGERALAERRAGDAAYSRSAEFRRIAAVYAHDDAEHRRDDRAAALLEAELTRDAWQAVPRLAALDAAQQRIRTLQAQLDAATTDAEPLRIARDGATATFAAALDEVIATLTDQLATAEQRRSEQAAAAQQAKSRHAQLTDERGRNRARLESLTEALAALDRDVATATTTGHLAPGEDLGAAQQRHAAADTAAKAVQATVVEDKAGLRLRRGELTTHAGQLRETRQRLQHERDTTGRRRTDLAERISELADDERLRLLAAADDVDVLGEGTDLMTQLAEQIIRADKRRVELGVEGAEDNRAVAALDATGLLPPVLDVVRALDELDAEQIAATSGWAYLADSVPGPLRARVLAAAPALAAGVLVHNPDDLDDAQRLLSTAGLRPTSAVAVAATADLHAVVEAVQAGMAGTAFLIPPAPALLDKAAAGEELRLRELARDDRAEHEDNLTRQRAADDDLRRRLGVLLTDCPPGTLESLESQLAVLDEQLRELAEQLDEVPARLTALDDEDKELDRRNTAAQQIRQQSATSLGALGGLATRTTVAEPHRAEVSALPGDIEQLTGQLLAAEADEHRARTAVEEAREEITARSATLTARRGERTALGDTVPTAASVSVDDARQQWEAADAAYRKETSGSELAAQLTEARLAVASPSAEVAALPVARRDAAQALFGTADGRDPGLRVAAIRRAEAAEGRLREETSAAEVALRLAQAEVDQYTPPDRPRHVVLDDADVPPTREAALVAARAAETEQQLRLRAENDARAKAAEAASAAAEAGSRAGSLGTLVLLVGEPDDPAPAQAEPFAGTLSEAQDAADGMRARLRDAGEEETRRARTLQDISTELVVWANDDRFLAVKPDVRGRFRVADAAAELGPGAATLAEDLRVYAANLRGRLTDLEEDKKVVVTAMTGMVRQALKTLTRAQSMSQLPDTIEQWKGQRFLEVGPRSSVDTSDPVVTDRCARLVDVITSRGAEVPGGLELLWQATSAVVGDGNWKARVLKPSTTFAADRVSVEKMRKWSGGEKVTISLLLFCMVVKLRAANRGRDLPGLGTLPLDNPLGKANYVVFLDLQRKVATANGVQLLFLTGVGDMKAVGRYPNIIRLRNTPNGGREYVRVAERRLADDDPAGVVDTTRIWREDPVMKLL